MTNEAALFDMIGFHVAFYAREAAVLRPLDLPPSEIAFVVAHRSSPLFEQLALLTDGRGTFEISEDCIARIADKAEALELRTRIVGHDPGEEVFPGGDDLPAFPDGYIGTVIGVGRRVRTGIMPILPPDGTGAA